MGTFFSPQDFLCDIILIYLKITSGTIFWSTGLENYNFQAVKFSYNWGVGKKEGNKQKKELEVGVLIHLLNFFPEVIMRCPFHNI